MALGSRWCSRQSLRIRDSNFIFATVIETDRVGTLTEGIRKMPNEQRYISHAANHLTKQMERTISGSVLAVGTILPIISSYRIFRLNSRPRNSVSFEWCWHSFFLIFFVQNWVNNLCFNQFWAQELLKKWRENESRQHSIDKRQTVRSDNLVFIVAPWLSLQSVNKLYTRNRNYSNLLKNVSCQPSFNGRNFMFAIFIDFS